MPFQSSDGSVNCGQTASLPSPTAKPAKNISFIRVSSAPSAMSNCPRFSPSPEPANY